MVPQYNGVTEFSAVSNIEGEVHHTLIAGLAIIDVKTMFRFFYSGHVFLFCQRFFFIFKNVH